MKPEKIFENTWAIDDDGVRIFILAGTKRALVIDTGRSGLDVRPMVEGVTDLPYELINTHADPDHIAGNRFFPSFFMHPSEAVVYYNLNGGTGHFRPVYDGDVTDLGDRELEIVHVPGHTPGSITILDRKNHCLIGGDPIQRNGRIYMFGIHRDLHSYIYSLERLMARSDFDLIYPSHADLPVEKSVIPDLIAGAKAVLSGESEVEPVTVHGKQVAAFDSGCSILLCDLKHFSAKSDT